MLTTDEAKTPQTLAQLDEAGLYCVGAFCPVGSGSRVEVALNGTTILCISAESDGHQHANTFVGNRGDMIEYSGPAGVELHLTRLGGRYGGAQEERAPAPAPKTTTELPETAAATDAGETAPNQES